MVEQEYPCKQNESKIAQASQVVQGNTKGARELRCHIAAASCHLAHFAQQQQQNTTGSKQRVNEYRYIHMICHHSADWVYLGTILCGQRLS
jgi:hypothetical protein